jgi:predicted nucleotidyltransferase
MPQEKLLAQVAAVLNDAGIDYVVTGSVVTSVYGEPRYTQDVDIVVAADPRLGEALARVFAPPRYYVDAQDVNESLRKGLICNLIDTDVAEKVDFHPLKAEPFERSFFDRRRKVLYAGVELWFPSAEDAILSKLRWARATGDGERHVRDARAVFHVQGPALDQDYLREWAERLSVSDLLRGLEAGETD